MKKVDKYFCDLCSVRKVERASEGGKKKLVKKLKFYSTHHVGDFMKHLESAKHIKNENRDKDKSIYCKWCDTYFSPDGYMVHEKRNKEMWKFKKIMPNAEFECNDFIKDGYRYASFEELKNDGDNRAKKIRQEKRKQLTKDQQRQEYKNNGCVIIGAESDSEPEFVDVNPIHDNEICDECDKKVFYSQRNNSINLNKLDIEYLNYNYKNRFCKCYVEQKDPITIEVDY